MTKFTSFVNFQITVYRGSWAVEIVDGAKNRVLSPMKMARSVKIHEFCRIPNYRVPGSRAVEIVPGAKNRVL